MGLTLVERLQKIFGKRSNFDISGICNPELVTVSLAKELAETISNGSWKPLADAGFEIHQFGGAVGNSGIVGKWVQNGSSKEHLKLYYDQLFPREIEKMKKEEALINGG